MPHVELSGRVRRAHTSAARATARSARALSRHVSSFRRNARIPGRNDAEVESQSH